jgi:hypothetical protein
MTDKKDLAFYQAQPERYKIGSNGSIYDLEQGRFTDLIVELNPHAITSANAREMALRGRELSRQRAVEALDEAAIERGLMPRNGTGGQGWKYIVKHVATTLLESKSLRAQAEAAQFLGKASGNLTEQREAEEDIAQGIVRLFEKFLDRDDAKGRVIDG